MAKINFIRLAKPISLLSCFLYPLDMPKDTFTCTEQIQNGLNALSKSIVYDVAFRRSAINYFDQWNSTSNYSTEFEDFLETLDEEPALPDSNDINITIDTIFGTTYKPSLGFPYQYNDVDMERLAKAGTEKHSITQQPIRSTEDILKRTPCKLDQLRDVNNRIVFGSHLKTLYVNILVSEYYRNNKFGCVEFSMIPSRLPKVMHNKIDFDSYYFQITCFINLESREIEFHRVGIELRLYGPYSVTDTLAIFTN